MAETEKHSASKTNKERMELLLEEGRTISKVVKMLVDAGAHPDKALEAALMLKGTLTVTTLKIDLPDGMEALAKALTPLMPDLAKAIGVPPRNSKNKRGRRAGFRNQE